MKSPIRKPTHKEIDKIEVMLPIVRVGENS